MKSKYFNPYQLSFAFDISEWIDIISFLEDMKISNYIIILFLSFKINIKE